MSHLVIDELRTTLSQSFTITSNNRVNVAGIRPYLYMHNAPAGTFTLSVKNGAETLASQTFTSAEIQSDLSTANAYAYLWKTITFDNPLQLDADTYTLEISSSGYTFSETGYLAWIKEHENQWHTQTGTADSVFDNTFSFQIFDYKEAI